MFSQLKTSAVNFNADHFLYPQDFNDGLPVMKRVVSLLRRYMSAKSIIVTCLYQGIWYKASSGIVPSDASLEGILYHGAIARRSAYEVSDLLKHPTYKFIVLKMGLPMMRYAYCMPVSNGDGDVIGTIILLDERPGLIEANTHLWLRRIAVLLSRKM